MLLYYCTIQINTLTVSHNKVASAALHLSIVDKNCNLSQSIPSC